MKFAFCALIFLPFLCLPSQADTIHVPTDYGSIQGALDAANDGDAILVAAGTYFENIDYLGKSVILSSLSGPSQTTIDGNQSGSVVSFVHREGKGSVLEGFTIKNGNGTEASSHHFGGGIYLIHSSPIIRNNIISRNRVDYSGGGICCDQYSGPEITNNRIEDNEARYHGGGIFCDNASFPVVNRNIIRRNVVDVTSGADGSPDSNGAYSSIISDVYSGAGIHSYASSPEISENTIYDNTAEFYGGGVFCGLKTDNNVPKILNNQIYHNTAMNGAGVYSCHKTNGWIRFNSIYDNTAEKGGGICVRDDTSRMVSNEIFENNAVDGGGVYSNHSSSRFDDNSIENNQVQNNGGGVYCYQGDLIFTNNTNFKNEAVIGGGFFCEETTLHITNDTIAQNSAGGIYLYNSTCAMENTILWGNFGAAGPQLHLTEASDVTVGYCDVEGGEDLVRIDPGSTMTWGEGMLELDPFFRAPGLGDYHLVLKSPCIDMGDNGAIYLLDKDFEGDPRIALGAGPGYGQGCIPLRGGHLPPPTVDIGADEFFNLKARSANHTVH